MNQEQSNRSKLLPIVFFGILSVIFAEVFSGSAPLWFTDAWGIFVVFPLYWIHALFLLNLAIMYKRTSLTQLYLWGIIFGLYEGWITKVIWAGYMGEPEPAFGSIFGFATAEFMVIGLFWHAIFSFIVPILVFEIVILGRSSTENVELLTGHHKYLVSTQKKKVLFVLIFVVGSFFLPMGLGTDIAVVCVAVIGNILIFWTFLWLNTRSGNPALTLSTLKLGRRGLVISAIYLILLNCIMFFVLLPERIPPIETLLLTVGFYVVILLLLYISPPSKSDSIELSTEHFFNPQILKNGFTLFTFLILVWIVIIDLALIAATVIYLGFILLGPILFIYSVIWVIRSRISSKNSHFDV